MVSMPSRRVSSWPVAIGKVRQSTRMSSTRMPQLSTRSLTRRSATRTFHSAVRAWPSSSMVRATTAAPCSLTIGIICCDARAGAVAVLVVDRVDDGAAAEHLERRLDDGRLGGVDDERDGRRRGEPPDDLADVGDAVAADVVDAHVEQVGAVLDLVLRDAHAVVPPLLEHRLAERLGAVGVRALADGEVRRVLPERHVLVHARGTGVATRRAAARSRGRRRARPPGAGARASCRSSRRRGRGRTRG